MEFKSTSNRAEAAASGGVLVIEDSEVMKRRYLSVLTTGRVYVCGVASTATEGLRMARKLCPDVVILDHMLPDGTGLQIMPGLMEDRSDLTVIVVSAAITAELAQQYIRLGVRRMIRKPINEHELLQVVKDSLSPTARQLAGSL